MTADDQPIPSAWTRPPRGRRERPALSREQIVAEAIRLLDAEGVEALSMRKLGTSLGAGATSLYRHVTNKDELMELVLDEVFGELRPPVATDEADWREIVAEGAHNVRAMILRHPWLASVLGQIGTAYLGPNLMRQSENMLALLESAGFSLKEAESAASTVFSYVIGMTSAEAAMLAMLARNGRTEADWAQQVLPAAQQAVASYPRLSALYLEYGDKDPQQTRDEDFARGLDHILDGLAVALGAERARRTD
ncbi:TetR/AcrR family transcriptional regulator [Streptomyces sp. NPDC053048]|uniref:TetR/AcrR family transcriptional regulator n=1 Tax=Streptomyces sp. NPDC053048 TaxID=3365694 RepID=UPI0037D45526